MEEFPKYNIYYRTECLLTNDTSLHMSATTINSDLQISPLS